MPCKALEKSNPFSVLLINGLGWVTDVNLNSCGTMVKNLMRRRSRNGGGFVIFGRLLQIKLVY